jgi:large subunit ribosomal protein L29
MKAEEIREWENGEIHTRLEELKQELFRLRFKSATQQLENPRLINNIRRDIARLNTILRERELAQQGS